MRYIEIQRGAFGNTWLAVAISCQCDLLRGCLQIPCQPEPKHGPAKHEPRCVLRVKIAFRRFRSSIDKMPSRFASGFNGLSRSIIQTSIVAVAGSLHCGKPSFMEFLLWEEKSRERQLHSSPQAVPVLPCPSSPLGSAGRTYPRSDLRQCQPFNFTADIPEFIVTGKATDDSSSSAREEHTERYAYLPFVILLGWIPAGAYLFRRYPVRIAILANFLGGWAILRAPIYQPTPVAFPYWILGVCLPADYSSPRPRHRTGCTGGNAAFFIPRI